MTVAELMETHGRGWNYEMINELFLPFECERILRIRLGKGNKMGEDEWGWDVERDGIYTVKFAYKLLACCDTNREETSDFKREAWLWNKIWKCSVMPRIKVFFWQLCHDALATNWNRARRIRGVEDSCPNCHARKETCLHVIRDCGWVGGIWEGLGLELSEDAGFERVREWVEAEMRDVGEEEWQILMVGCWAIWERRNKMVFEGVRWCEAEVVERARNLLWEMNMEVRNMLWETNREGQNTEEGQEGGVMCSGVEKEGARHGKDVCGGRIARERVRGRQGQERVGNINVQGGRGRSFGQDEGSLRSAWQRPEQGMCKINVDAGIKMGIGVAWGVVCRNEEGGVQWCVTVQ